VQKRASRILPRHLLSPPQFRDHDMRSFRATSTNRGKDDQEDFSAQQSSPKEKAWVPSSDEDESRPGDPQGTPSQGSDEAVCLAHHMSSHRPLSSTRDWLRVRAAPAVRYGELTVRVSALERRSEPSRLGLVVRGADTAVLRNRIRRRLRAAFCRSGFRGHDVIVVATQRSATTDFQALVDQLREALSRAAAGA
jgi:ribonuclease P protein component